MTSLIMIGGLSGSGKTTVSKVLAKMWKAAFIDKDTVTSGFVDQMMITLGRTAHDRDSQEYLDKVRPIEYQCFLDTVLENVALGNRTIACAPFLTEFSDDQWRKDIEQRVAAANPCGTVSYFWINCDLEITRQRILLRDNPRDRLKLTVWDDYVNFAGSLAPMSAPVSVVDNSSSNDVRKAAREIEHLHNLGLPTQHDLIMTSLAALGRDPRNRPDIANKF
jgi:gluconate kinase